MVKKLLPTDKSIDHISVKPIGQFLDSVNDLTIKLQAWFNWDSSGNRVLLCLRFLQWQYLAVLKEWDEDPVCQTIGPQYFVEDGLGILIPLLDRCVDDRTNSEDLSVSFSVADDSLLARL